MECAQTRVKPYIGIQWIILSWAVIARAGVPLTGVADSDRSALHLDGEVHRRVFQPNGQQGSPLRPTTFSMTVSGGTWLVRLVGDTNYPGAVTDVACNGTNIYIMVPGAGGTTMAGNSTVPFAESGAVYPGQIKDFSAGVMGPLWWGYCSTYVLGPKSGFVPDFLGLLGPSENGFVSEKVYVKCNNEKLTDYFGPVQAMLYETNPIPDVARLLAEIDPIGTSRSDGLNIVTNYLVVKYYQDISSSAEHLPRPMEKWEVTITRFYFQTNIVGVVPTITDAALIDDFEKPNPGQYVAHHWLTAAERKVTAATPVLATSLPLPNLHTKIKRAIILTIILTPLVLICYSQIRSRRQKQKANNQNP
ncbi:MAG TPA: hypothetical protein VH280_12740 [Verrucomicrobiae bacterium]|jgi:hypothetical protein|nr:hypothetical protein [Verrucomicrobiae bacterium]